MTVNASYNFLRSAKLGDHLVAEARETKPGRTLCFYEVEIRDQAGTLLGNGSFTFYKLDREYDGIMNILNERHRRQEMERA